MIQIQKYNKPKDSGKDSRIIYNNEGTTK